MCAWQRLMILALACKGSGSASPEPTTLEGTNDKCHHLPNFGNAEPADPVEDRTPAEVTSHRAQIIETGMRATGTGESTRRRGIVLNPPLIDRHRMGLQSPLITLVLCPSRSKPPDTSKKAVTRIIAGPYTTPARLARGRKTAV